MCKNISVQDNLSWNSLVVQWLGLSAFTVEGPGVRSLVRELRSHKAAWGVQKKKKRLFIVTSFYKFTN